jgi:hypothetical protein
VQGENLKKILIGMICLGSVINTCAWGHEGHRLVALVAESRLTPEAHEQVHVLLGRESIADVASFADDYRQDHASTGPWHYVDIPYNQFTYDRDRDCPAAPASKSTTITDPWRDCVVDRIPYFIAQLKNPALGTKNRAFALKMLVHLVGDIHQPLHAVGDARGGNQIRVVFFGSDQCGERQMCNLHGIWDDGLIEHRSLNEKKYVELLESEIAQHKWDGISQENPAVWANQSHQLAVNAWVPDRAGIGKAYYDAEIPVVDRQLAVAGIRLARMLNAIFVASPSAPVERSNP